MNFTHSDYIKEEQSREKKIFKKATRTPEADVNAENSLLQKTRNCQTIVTTVENAFLNFRGFYTYLSQKLRSVLGRILAQKNQLRYLSTKSE